MSPELDALLCQRYPKIFAERHQSARDSCMGRGFECADGWFSLIDTLCEHLQFDTDHNQEPQVVATQVKEKFGSLRFRCKVAGTDDETDLCRCSPSEYQRGMIAMATGLSMRLCERCGKPGTQVTRPGRSCMQTCCAEHIPTGFEVAKTGSQS